ncbi:Myophilin [Phytophthora ramorum]|uniref:Myophilin n=1 Tax=Phytophthora ramorum TaxID=164328 RepID=UPI0030A88037|nr:Myophilin [Phytophthora ramorum]
MDMNLNVLVPNHNEVTDVRESAMGGKHQRSLSLSAKWASDKAMAIEYLRRQREVMTWIETVLKHELPTTDLFEALKSGVVLRETMETLFPDVSNCMSPISRNYSKRMAPWKERENISVFLRQCKSIGMYDLSLFCTDDLYEGTNMVQVLFCVQHFMMFSAEHAGHLFNPVAKIEPTEFSNQELEMAMSKIEQAGVDAKALQGLISASSSSAVPEKAASHEKKSTVRAASETASVLQLKRVKEEEPAEREKFSEEKANVQPEESGSEAVNEEEEAQPQVSVASELEGGSVVACFAELTSAHDEETLVVIQQVLSDMASAIEEAEAESHAKTTPDIIVVEAEPEVPNVEIIHTPDEAAEKEEKGEDEEGITEVAEDTVLGVKGEATDQANIEIQVTEESANPAAGSTDVPTELTPVDEVASTQPASQTAENAAGDVDDKPQQTEDEELEAKAMAKCTCGRCTIM